MKRYFLLFGSPVLVLFLPIALFAQDETTGGWSAGFFTSLHYAVSSSMHGSITDYEGSLAKGITPAQYPFDANRALSISFGVQIERRFEKSPLGYYFTTYGVGFRGGSNYRFSSNGSFSMSILSIATGLEYTFGQIYQRWNFYGRAGLVPSVI